MTADRPATSLWAGTERERQLVRNAQETEWRRRILHAGSVNPAQLSNRALRIVAWLAEWDDWTVDGVTELLAAAHRSGAEAGRREPMPARELPADDGTAAAVPGRVGESVASTDIAAVTGVTGEAPVTGAGSSADAPHDASGRVTDQDAADATVDRIAGGQVDATDLVKARLAALRQRSPSPAVGL
jgi:hypothetical protein